MATQGRKKRSPGRPRKNNYLAGLRQQEQSLLKKSEKLISHFGQRAGKYVNRKSLMKWYATPTGKYVTVGVGLAILIPVMLRLSRRYPRIKTFVKEKLENLEDTLAEYAPKVGPRRDIEARH